MNVCLVMFEFGDMVVEDFGEVCEYEVIENGVCYVVSEICKVFFL